jgi:hypothetical protein
VQKWVFCNFCPGSGLTSHSACRWFFRVSPLLAQSHELKHKFVLL